MERQAFNFDGGTVRLTFAGQFLVTLAQMVFWVLIIGGTLATMIIALAAYLVRF